MTDKRIISRDGTFYIRAQDVRRGDLLDLEGDKYADPNGDGTNDDGAGGKHYEPFAFDLAEVLSTGREPAVCVVETTQGTYAVPPDHEFNLSLATKEGLLA